MSAPNVSGRNAGIEHFPGHRKAEMRAVTDIDLEAAGDRLVHHRMQPPVLSDKPAGMTGERVGQDIARLQQVEYIGQDAVGIDAALAAAGNCQSWPKWM